MWGRHRVRERETPDRRLERLLRNQEENRQRLREAKASAAGTPIVRCRGCAFHDDLVFWTPRQHRGRIMGFGCPSCERPVHYDVDRRELRHPVRLHVPRPAFSLEMAVVALVLVSALGFVALASPGIVPDGALRWAGKERKVAESASGAPGVHTAPPASGRGWLPWGTRAAPPEPRTVFVVRGDHRAEMDSLLAEMREAERAGRRVVEEVRYDAERNLTFVTLGAGADGWEKELRERGWRRL